MVSMRPEQTNIEVYQSHNPQDFHEALDEFNQYCERQLPKAAFIGFVPICFDITMDEQTIIIGGQHGNIASFDVLASSILRDEEVSHNTSIINIMLALDDTQAIALASSSELFFLDFPSLELLHKIILKPYPTSLKNVSIKQSLYYLSGTKEIGVIKLSREEDFYTKKFQKRSFAVDYNTTCMEISDDATLLAIGMDNGMISIIHVDREIKLKNTPEYPSNPNIVAFSEGHHFLAAGFENNNIRV